jgi:hypothetical protein
MKTHHFFRRFVSGLFILLVCRSSLFGCLNDTSVDRSESEFRSSYDTPRSVSESRFHGISFWGLGALALGGGLAAGSLIVTLRRGSNGMR